MSLSERKSMMIVGLHINLIFSIRSMFSFIPVIIACIIMNVFSFFFVLWFSQEEC